MGIHEEERERIRGEGGEIGERRETDALLSLREILDNEGIIVEEEADTDECECHVDLGPHARRLLERELVCGDRFFLHITFALAHIFSTQATTSSTECCKTNRG